MATLPSNCYTLVFHSRKLSSFPEKENHVPNSSPSFGSISAEHSPLHYHPHYCNQISLSANHSTLSDGGSGGGDGGGGGKVPDHSR